MSFSRSLKARAGQVWEDGYNHPFVQELGKGTLAQEKFQFYLMQDYHYLIEYARVFALGAVKAQDEELMTRMSTIQYNILANEMDLHRTYMAEFGVTQAQLAAVKPSLFNRTYTANILATGQTGDIAAILAAVFPCAWTYAEYAKRLKEQYADVLEGNFYKTWIENYAGTHFEESFAWFYDTLDELVEYKSEAERDRIAEIFISSVEFEYLFWDMAYKQEMSYDLARDAAWSQA
jgi:thiaminase/transcriptional activator TenA